MTEFEDVERNSLDLDKLLEQAGMPSSKITATFDSEALTWREITSARFVRVYIEGEQAQVCEHIDDLLRAYPMNSQYEPLVNRFAWTGDKIIAIFTRSRPLSVFGPLDRRIDDAYDQHIADGE
jgi:hypothetical protein